MASLFVANTSNKNNEFLFRLPGIEQLRRVIIAAGKQVQILKDVHNEEIESVITQHQIYGLTSANDIAKANKFVGLLYAIDKPVSINSMELAIEKNNDILLEDGYELRKLAAVAMNESVLPEVKKSLEIEIVEIPEDRTASRKMMTEKIKVKKD